MTGFKEAIAAADTLRDRRDWVKASAAYREAVNLRPEVAAVHVQLGHALKESGDFAGAEAAYLAARALDLRDGDIAFQLGHLFNRQEDIAAAVKWYEVALELVPNDEDVRRHLKEARARLVHGPSDALVQQSQRAMATRDYVQARDLLLAATLKHGREDIFCLLGHALKECGEFDAAEQAYLRYRAYSVTHAPDMLPDVALQLAHLFKIRGDFPLALTHYIDAKQLTQRAGGRFDEAGPVASEIDACLRVMYPLLARR